MSPLPLLIRFSSINIHPFSMHPSFSHNFIYFFFCNRSILDTGDSSPYQSPARGLFERLITMSVLDNSDGGNTIDDTEKLSCTITGHETVSSHTVRFYYTIRYYFIYLCIYLDMLIKQKIRAGRLMICMEIISSLLYGNLEGILKILICFCKRIVQGGAFQL